MVTLLLVNGGWVLLPGPRPRQRGGDGALMSEHLHLQEEEDSV